MANDPLEAEVKVDTDQAADDVDRFVDAAERKLGDLEPTELELEPGDAFDDIEKLQDRLHDLGEMEIVPEIRPDVDTAAIDRSGDDIRNRLETKGGEAGKRFGGSFAADFGGVINQEVGQVGDGLVQGLGAALEGAGASASFAGPLIAALGIGTVVAAAAKTLWDKLNEGAEQYKKSLEEAATVQQSLATGDLRNAMEGIDQKLGPLADTMARFGISTQEAGEFILGTKDNLAGLTDIADDEIWGLAAEQIATYGGEHGETANAIEKTRDTLRTMRDANAEMGGSLQESQLRMFELLKAAQGVTHSTEDTTDAMLDLADETSGPTFDAIMQHIGALNNIPPSAMTDILALPDKEAVAAAQKYIADHTHDETVYVQVIPPDLSSLNKIRDDLARGWHVPVYTAPAATKQGVDQYQQRNGPIK